MPNMPTGSTATTGTTPAGPPVPVGTPPKPPKPQPTDPKTLHDDALQIFCAILGHSGAEIKTIIKQAYEDADAFNLGGQEYAAEKQKAADEAKTHAAGTPPPTADTATATAAPAAAS
jgi:hypothetical protein